MDCPRARAGHGGAVSGAASGAGVGGTCGLAGDSAVGGDAAAFSSAMSVEALWPRRGELWRAFTPRQPDDPHQPRPVLVISANTRNRLCDDVVVIPIFSQGRRGPTRVPIAAGVGGLDRDSVLFYEEITTIDRDFLGAGSLGPPYRRPSSILSFLPYTMHLCREWTTGWLQSGAWRRSGRHHSGIGIVRLRLSPLFRVTSAADALLISSGFERLTREPVCRWSRLPAPTGARHNRVAARIV